MRKTLLSACLLIVVASYACNRQNETWIIKENPIITQWATQIDPAKPWDVYPRPAMKRENWMNLNGLWDYTIGVKGADMPTSWEGKILVPYPIESALSGVKRRVNENEVIWYRREFKVPAKWRNQRLILNFEASDWETTVWVNGELVGSHKGGYNPFSMEITKYAEKNKSVELMVSVWDPTDKGTQPRGKQVTRPGGIWYTPTSGIWQTVWLEPVNSSYISSFKVNTSVEEKTLKVSPVVDGETGMILKLTVFENGTIVGTDQKEHGEDLSVEITNPNLWTPDNPALYDLKLELIDGKKTIDAITSIAGIRKISLGKTNDGITRIMLNNEFLFQNGTLDQGFWPDGLYTPPTEDAMIYDLMMLKSMGFNMLRKHVKVENRVFYNWCDRMGLLVWQDMPNGDAHISGSMPDIERGVESDQQYRYELEQLVNSLYNHPSIIIWVPFNEGWGQYKTGEITGFIKSIDSGRLVISASGWTDRGTGDINDIHHYPDPRAPLPEENRAIVLGEYGGLGLAIENHTWEKTNWGYRVMTDVNDLLGKYEQYFTEIRRLSDEGGLSAVVYTQTTDVETETNGLLTYDRKVDKMGSENILKAHLGYLPPFKLSKESVFIDSFYLELKCIDINAVIRYTTDGSEPQITSQVYNNPILITTNTTVNAKAWYNGKMSRNVKFPIIQSDPSPSVDPTPENLKPGLTVSIFEGNFDMLPDFSTLTPADKTISGEITHKHGGKNSLYALVFEGFISIPDDGVYGIVLASDDGSRLFIDRKESITNDGIHGIIEKEEYLPLAKGLHPLRIDFFQRTGGVGLNLYIITPDGKREKIPSGWLFHSTH